MPTLIKRLAIGVVVLVVWVAASAGIMVSTELAPGALVLFPGKQFVSDLPDHIRILDWRDKRLVVTSTQPGYVAQLYAAGAWLVLPARKNGCVSGFSIRRSLGAER
jgi:hypothetical protein